MKFELLQHQLETFKELALPGIEAHEAILPYMARERIEAYKNDPSPKVSAVAATLYPKNGDAHVLLIERQPYKGVHSGQIAFPGGKQEDEDHSLQETALREMEEEVGIDRGLPRYIRTLSDVYIPPSRFLVHPHIFYIEEMPTLIKEAREVKSIVEFPLERLLDDKSVEVGAISLSNGVKIRSPYFSYQGHQIWGATAMMLSEMKQLLKQILP